MTDQCAALTIDPHGVEGCVGCGRPLAHKLACPFLIEYERDANGPGLQRLAFSRPIHRVSGQQVITTCPFDGKNYNVPTP